MAEAFAKLNMKAIHWYGNAALPILRCAIRASTKETLRETTNSPTKVTCKTCLRYLERNGAIIVERRPDETESARRDRIRLATCTECKRNNGTHTPNCQVGYGEAPDDAELRRMWKRNGGEFHGPNVETGCMPESKLLPFLRTLLR